MNPDKLASTLSIQFNYTHWVVSNTLDGITHTDALIQPAHGNCINWASCADWSARKAS